VALRQIPAYPGLPLLGNGLLSSSNDFHRPQCKLIAPALQHRAIRAYAGVMATFAQRLELSFAGRQPQPVELEQMVTLRPRHHIRMRVAHRR
jgi:cytochrome P450